MAAPVDVIVDHDYNATEDDELTLRQGEIVRNVEQKPGGWWRGEAHGRVGLFPDNFVSILTTMNQNEIISKNLPRFCRATYSYQQANADELNLTVGDIITVHHEIEEGWWRGQRGDDVGVFPSNFVIPLEATPPLPPKPTRELCRVLYQYKAANADELTLKEGDILTILSKDGPDQGWWRGELNGQTGLFPDNFVTLLPGSTGGDSGTKKPVRPAKKISLTQPKTTSISRKDSKSNENIAPIRKSLGTHEINSLENQKFKKSMESLDGSPETIHTKSRRIYENDSNTEVKYKKTSLDVDNTGGSGKPPIPVKKASSPVAAMFSGLKQKVFSSGDRGQQTTDTADGLGSSKLSGEPVLRSISPAPSPTPPLHSDGDQSVENFDQVERKAMLNDMRSGRVKGPPRRPPTSTMSQNSREEPMSNGSSHLNSSTESANEVEIRPKSREWEKHKAPWMEELKQNQAKKTTSIGDIGRAKTVSSTESNDKMETSPARLSSSSDKILESAETESKPSTNPLEMSQSMSSLSSRTIKMETTTEANATVQDENSPDMSKSLSTLTSKATLVEHNAKVSPNELRTSISSTANVILRSTTHMPHGPPSNLNAAHVAASRSFPVMETTFNSNDVEKRNTLITTNGTSHSDMTPEQMLIAQLNERVANLERVVETQESRFTSALAALSEKLAEEMKIRQALQAEIQKLERCVTRV